MTHDVYAPPKAALQEPIPATLRRPALIWFTQGLLLLFCLIAVGMVARGLLVLVPKGTVSASALGYALAFSAIQFALPASLLYGLAYRRRWSWYGAIALAVLLLAVVVWSRMYSTPVFEIKPKQSIGAAVADVAITFLLVLYPVRLFFSRKVRAFLGIRPR